MNSQDKRLLMEQWYRQYAALIFHYARQFTDHHSAEETVQETFRIAWEAVQQQEIEHPKAWLRKIAENVLKNQLRRSRRRSSLLAGPGRTCTCSSAWPWTALHTPRRPGS